jgi:hypothetical protein
MLTPWFAVSVGIVVATALSLAAPHPALTFPPTKSGHCAQTDCSTSSPLAKGRAPAIKKDAPLHATQLPGRQRTTANVRAAVRVEYQLMRRQHHQFIAVILIIGHKSLGKWNMQFTLPGAQIASILWARWARDGNDRLMVSGSPLPWPRSAANKARIVVFGSGTPGWPSRCTFDGEACTFRKLTSDPVRHAGMALPGS